METFQRGSDRHLEVLEKERDDVREENTQLHQQVAALTLHNEQCKVLVASVVDVYDVVLPYKILQKARVLLGRK